MRNPEAIPGFFMHGREQVRRLVLTESTESREDGLMVPAEIGDFR